MSGYALNPSLRNVYIFRVVQELRLLSGALHEKFGNAIIDRLVPVPMQHPGLNPQGAPVGHTLDSVSSDGKYVAEYSSETSYFDGRMKKPKKDYLHAISLHPQVEYLWLINNTKMSTKTRSRMINSVARIGRCNGIHLEIYDSLRTAEFIVDNLLLDWRTPEELGHFLPCLRTFSAEMAATHLVPSSSAHYVARQEVNDKVDELWKSNKVVTLSGISGSGKSALAADIILKRKENFHFPLWIDAKDLKRVEELSSYEYSSAGAAMNIFGLLHERSALVVLDDVCVSLDLAALERQCSASSRILITTQNRLADAVEIGPLGTEQARLVLSRDLPDACPNEISDRIRDNVGSNALALSLLNAFKREEAVSWQELESESQAADTLLDGSHNHEKLAVRLLARAQQRLASELQFLKWCETQTVDEEFAKAFIGAIGIKNLKQFNLLTRSREQTLRLHELVHKAIRTAVFDNAVIRREHDRKFEEFIAKRARAKAVSFVAVVHQQRHRILRQLADGNRNAGLVYSYFLSTGPKDIEARFAPDPQTTIKSLKLLSQNDEAELDVLALVESMEKMYLQIREQRSDEAAQQHLRSQISHIEALSGLRYATPSLSNVTKHHYAKALRRLGEVDKATELLLEITTSAAPLAASRLLLARIYAESSKKTQALSSIKAILALAVTSPDDVSPTVLLESVRMLLSPKLRTESKAVFEQFNRQIGDRIILLASVGFGQAFEAFAAVASYWAYVDPPLFTEIFESLPPVGREDKLTDQERKSWGEIYLAAAESMKGAALVNVEYAKRAVDLLSSRSQGNSYSSMRLAKAQILAGLLDDAEVSLNSIDVQERNYWWHFWKSLEYSARGKDQDALKEVDIAIRLSPDEMTVFFSARAELLFKRGDRACLDDMGKAVSLGGGNAVHTHNLQERLGEMEEYFRWS